MLLTLVERRGPRPKESPLETALIELLRDAVLPLPIPQYAINDKDTFLARPDFVYPEPTSVILEGDSWEWHSNRQAFDRDRARNFHLQRLGFMVLPITATAIKRTPRQLLRDIRNVLIARGHPGVSPANV